MRKKPNLGNITQKWVEMLAPFSGNYSAKLSASEVSRRCGMPQQTVSRGLNALSSLNIISYAKEGKNKLFYFDIESQKTKIVLNLIENQKALRFQLEAKEISVIIDEALKYCESLIVFGSYASGRFSKTSDIDLVVLGRCDRSGIKRIKQKQVVEINEHYSTYREFEKILTSRNPLSLEIQKNHVLFGDVSKVVDIFWRREYGRR